MKDDKCRRFKNELNQEITALKQFLNQYNQGPIPVKYAMYTNIVSIGYRFRNHLQHGLVDVCNRKEYIGWFKKKSKDDKIIKFFVDERGRLEHESGLKVNTGVSISRLSLPSDLLKYGPRPLNATGMFMDGLGIGWTIKQQDGSKVKLYVSLPENLVKTFIIPTSLPTDLKKYTIDYLLSYYVDYLENAFKEVEKEFD
jgi:hypothetical protein